ncbi:MAG TPA: cbb3-type cytochrome oxidase assembly protein CcoS [Vicinamibacterales bacterium]|nr:cbb3-type cytochrome oxidase assembly protein CcoS [Vicinamibacterales bacterium]
MSVLILLIAAGGTVASGFLIAFVWAVRSGQFDDTCTPAVRMLLDARTPLDDASAQRTTTTESPVSTRV